MTQTVGFLENKILNIKSGTRPVQTTLYISEDEWLRVGESEEIFRMGIHRTFPIILRCLMASAILPHQDSSLPKLRFLTCQTLHRDHYL